MHQAQRQDETEAPVARTAAHEAGAAHADAPPERRKSVRLMQCVNRMYARGYHRLEVLSPARLPARGAAILVCNHTSGLDPHLIQSACPRFISWMMAREYYEIRAIKPMLDALG